MSVFYQIHVLAYPTTPRPFYPPMKEGEGGAMRLDVEDLAREVSQGGGLVAIDTWEEDELGVVVWGSGYELVRYRDGRREWEDTTGPEREPTVYVTEERWRVLVLALFEAIVDSGKKIQGVKAVREWWADYPHLAPSLPDLRAAKEIVEEVQETLDLSRMLHNPQMVVVKWPPELEGGPLPVGELIELCHGVHHPLISQAITWALLRGEEEKKERARGVRASY